MHRSADAVQCEFLRELRGMYYTLTKTMQAAIYQERIDYPFFQRSSLHHYISVVIISLKIRLKGMSKSSVKRAV